MGARFGLPRDTCFRAMGSALMRPDVEFLQSRCFARRVDGPLDVVQVERIELALPWLQWKVEKTTERTAELESVVGVARVGDALDHLDPARVERIRPARGGTHRPS